MQNISCSSNESSGLYDEVSVYSNDVSDGEVVGGLARSRANLLDRHDAFPDLSTGFDSVRSNDTLHNDPFALRGIGAVDDAIIIPTDSLDMDAELDALLPENTGVFSETDERVHHRSGKFTRSQRPLASTVLKVFTPELETFLEDSDPLVYLRPSCANEIRFRCSPTEFLKNSTFLLTVPSLSGDVEKYYPGLVPRRNRTHVRYLVATIIMALAVGSFVLLRYYRMMFSVITTCGLALLFKGLGLFFLLAAFFWTFF